MSFRFAYSGSSRSSRAGCSSAACRAGVARVREHPAGRHRRRISRARTIRPRRAPTVFTNECANCHGQRGEGLASAPPILGPGALPEYPRDTGRRRRSDRHRPAADPDPGADAAGGRALARSVPKRQDLYTFTTTHLPKGRAAQSEGRRLLGRDELHARGAGGQPAAGRHRPRQRGLDPDSQALTALSAARKIFEPFAASPTRRLLVSEPSWSHQNDFSGRPTVGI